MSEENGRIDYLREDLKTLNEVVRQGFENMTKQITILKDNFDIKISDYSKQTDDKIKDVCYEIEKVEKKVEKNSKNIGNVEKRLFKVAFIGGGLGFIFGIIFTRVVELFLKTLS
ncbi:MAG: hypothetical protein ACOCRO_01950 [Halanaerobiales bacterium]